MEFRVSRSRKRRFQFGIKTIIAAPVVVGLLIMTDFFGLVGLRYPRAYENEPLQAPIRVTRVDGSMLRLEDGRVLHFDDWQSSLPLDKWIADSSGVIDVVSFSNYPNEVEVLVKNHRFICGTPYIGLITNFPLIAVNVPRYERRFIDIVRVTHDREQGDD